MAITEESGPDRAPTDGRLRRLASALARRTASFGAVWWIVSGGALGSLLFGAAAAVIAAAASLALMPPPLPRLRLAALLAFIPYFLKASVLGGLDVVRRAFQVHMALSPSLTRYDVSAMNRTERTVFALAVNLLPGTLSVRLEGPVLRLHAIDQAMPVDAALAELDARIGAIFGRTGARAFTGEVETGSPSGKTKKQRLRALARFGEKRKRSGRHRKKEA